MSKRKARAKQAKQQARHAVARSKAGLLKSPPTIERDYARLVTKAVRAAGIAAIKELEATRRSDSFQSIMATIARAIDEALPPQSLWGELQAIGKRTEKNAVKKLARAISIKAPELETGQVTKWTLRNANLISDVISEQTRQVAVAVQAGFAAGRQSSEIAKEIAAITGKSASRARLIARDQVLTLNKDVMQSRAKAAGATHYEWSTSNDSAVRDHHAALDGKIFRYDDPPLGGGTAEDEYGNPGDGILCRCTALPIFEGV